MERLLGDPVSSAIWAIEAFGEPSFWGRTSLVIKECLGIERELSDTKQNRLRWIADTLRVTAEFSDVPRLPEFRITIEVLAGFESQLDGVFLASNLNHTAVGGAFVYSPDDNSLCFVLSCLVLDWHDFALLLLAARLAISHCENLSRRADVLRFSKCVSAAGEITTRSDSAEFSNLMLERLSDTLQVDYIASLFISDREATRLRSRITTECDWAEIFERDLTDSAARVIESLDFAFTIPIDDELRSTFGGNEAVASVDFNRWTEFGRAVIIELALPFFTWPGIFDDGASHDEAVRVANALNDSDKKLGWQKLGLGAWFAKGSQICFSMALPHTILKPVILGCISSQVADVLFEVINPNAVRKLVRECGRALQATNLESQRDVQEMDSLDSLKRLRKRHGASRASNETLTTNERSHSLWDLASGPLLVYGVFNPVGSTLGSVELIYGVSKNYVAHKFRHPFSPGIEILAEFHGDDEIPSSVIHVIKGLHEKISLPHVVYVPLDLRPDFRNQVIEGLLEVFKNYSESGIDLRKAAERVRDQPNPWWRTEIERGNEKSTGKVSTGELSPWEDYLSTVMNPSLIDYNFALFQGWWEGAWAFQRDPNSPDKATEVVENFTQNVLDRASLD